MSSEAGALVVVLIEPGTNIPIDEFNGQSGSISWVKIRMLTEDTTSV